MVYLRGGGKGEIATPTASSKRFLSCYFIFRYYFQWNNSKIYWISSLTYLFQLFFYPDKTSIISTKVLQFFSLIPTVWQILLMPQDQLMTNTFSYFKKHKYFFVLHIHLIEINKCNLLLINRKEKISKLSLISCISTLHIRQNKKKCSISIYNG